jgi:beta-glucosidase
MAVSHHLLLSHGLALQATRAAGVPAPLGIVLNHSPIHPATESAEDHAKARLDDGLAVRWYMDPLLTGSYPADVLEFLGPDAPPVVGDDMAQIRQPLDFLGVNYYTRNVSGTGALRDPVHSGREVTDMGWEVFPEGLSELLVRLHDDYRLPPVYIMENGAAYPDRLSDGRVDDPNRVRYLASHIESMANAMSQGVDVRGYFVWSLFDNFEWADGYTKRFGIVYIDYETQRRIPKQSALWYRRFLACARDHSASSKP